ncbi:MAG: hypothetical protein WBG73_14885 [Coleofasciculaceae cyanobacterium]
MLVSTFELLTKPIAPAGSGPAVVARTVVQGYFLTVANPNNIDVKLQLQFTATTPNLNTIDTVTILDVNGTNNFTDLSPVPGDPKKFSFNLVIPANDTALVTLLPDLRTDVIPPFGVPDVLTKTLEIRGYVEIFVQRPISFRGVNLLLTPEHRGTFLPQNLAAPNPDFDQLVYSLPTATGSSLFKVGGFILPISDALNDTADTTPVVPLNSIEQMFDQMAERINGLEKRLESAGQSFISVQQSSNGDQVSNQKASIS